MQNKNFLRITLYECKIIEKNLLEEYGNYKISFNYNTKTLYTDKVTSNHLIFKEGKIFYFEIPNDIEKLEKNEKELLNNIIINAVGTSWIFFNTILGSYELDITKNYKYFNNQKLAITLRNNNKKPIIKLLISIWTEYSLSNLISNKSLLINNNNILVTNTNNEPSFVNLNNCSSNLNSFNNYSSFVNLTNYDKSERGNKNSFSNFFFNERGSKLSNQSFLNNISLTSNIINKRMSNNSLNNESLESLQFNRDSMNIKYHDSQYHNNSKVSLQGTPNLTRPNMSYFLMNLNANKNDINKLETIDLEDVKEMINIYENNSGDKNIIKQLKNEIEQLKEKEENIEKQNKKNEEMLLTIQNKDKFLSKQKSTIEHKIKKFKTEQFEYDKKLNFLNKNITKFDESLKEFQNNEKIKKQTNDLNFLFNFYISTSNNSIFKEKNNCTINSNKVKEKPKVDNMDSILEECENNVLINSNL